MVQIAASGVDQVSSTQCELIVIALCDDGTLWESNNRHFGKWFPVAPPSEVVHADDLTNELAECVEALLSAFKDLCAGLRKSEIGINPNQLIERAEAAIECWRNDTGDHDA